LRDVVKTDSSQHNHRHCGSQLRCAERVAWQAWCDADFQ